MKRLHIFGWLLGMAGWFVAVVLSALIYDALPPAYVEGQGFMNVGDPYAVLRSAIRIIVLAPLCLFLAIGGVLLFDRLTPDDWLLGLTDDQKGNLGTKLATGIVVAVIILSMFWVGVRV